MTTSYPGDYDAYTDKVNNVSTVLATSVNNLQDAMEAMQALVGKIDSNNADTWTYKTQDFFEENVLKMYFFQAVAPVGWTVDTMASQCAIAVKDTGTISPLGDWNMEGGNYYDPYVPPGGSALPWWIDDMTENGHRHRWYDEEGGIPKMYDSDGVTLLTPIVYAEVTGVPMHNIQKGTDYRDNYGSGYFTWSGPESYHVHYFSGNWRPKAAVGIVATYTGL